MQVRLEAQGSVARDDMLGELEHAGRALSRNSRCTPAGENLLVSDVSFSEGWGMSKAGAGGKSGLVPLRGTHGAMLLAVCLSSWLCGA